MERIRIELPVDFDFETGMQLRVNDINYGGHLGNDSVLTLCQEARIRFLSSHGLSEMDIGDGIGMIQRDAAVVYKSQAMLGELIRIKLKAVPDGSGCLFFYLLLNAKTKLEIARARTGMAFFDYQRQRPVKIPATFLSRISQT